MAEIAVVDAATGATLPDMLGCYGCRITAAARAVHGISETEPAPLLTELTSVPERGGAPV